MNRLQHLTRQAAAEPGPGPDIQTQAPKNAPCVKPRILALENDPCLSLLEIFRPDFEELGYEFLTTGDEHEALHILLSQPIDLFMTNLAGRMWLLRLLKSEARLRHLRVLVVSAYSKVAAIDMLREAGLVLYRDLAGYLEKPFAPQEMVTFVGAILSRQKLKG